MELSATRQYPALVLNADFRPLSYFPLSLWSWQNAIRAVFLERVTVLSQYKQAVRSPSTTLHLPSVVALKDYVPPQRRPAFTRLNVFLRDRFTCQYCDTRLSATELTFDHVTPRFRGGRTQWNNIVTACSPCNLRKGSKSLEETDMTLRHLPQEPSYQHLHENGRLFPPHQLDDSWEDYLYWNTELDQ